LVGIPILETSPNQKNKNNEYDSENPTLQKLRNQYKAVSVFVISILEKKKDTNEYLCIIIHPRGHSLMANFRIF
jgi:hypothetical protein